MNSRVTGDKRRMLMRKADEMDGKEQMDGETREQPVWTVRSLSSGETACDGVRWWAQRARNAFKKLGESAVVAFPEGTSVSNGDRCRVLQELMEILAPLYGGTANRVVARMDLTVSYRGIGLFSPVVLVDGIPEENLLDFAKELCSLANERHAVVHPADGEEMWWLEHGPDSGPLTASFGAEGLEDRMRNHARVKASSRNRTCHITFCIRIFSA